MAGNNQHYTQLSESELNALATSLPPPPYSVNAGGDTDLTPTPHSLNRPRLPARRNEHLDNLPDDINIVKFQTIVREGKEIIIGRVKVPTPASTGQQHAFILRRYDTDAISLTTMYKVAFPGATEEDERREMDWVRTSFDTTGTNGGREPGSVRLAGQWVSQHLAIHLAPAYNMKPLVVALARAVPDPNVSYRKSQRSQAAAAELAAKNTSTATPTTTRTAPSLTAPEADAPTPKRRRAAETQSTDEQRRVTLEATTTVTAPAGAAIDVNAEIESAKQLVRDLKRELQLRAAAGDEFEETGGADVAESSNRGKKRAAEDEGTAISGGAGKTEERIIRTNRRVEQTTGGAAKRVAFGAMLFGLGASAALFLPQLAAQYL